MHSHNLPLVAVLWLPAALALVRRLPGVTPTWRRANPLTRAALLLMAVAAVVHLALIPAHSSEPVTAILFALDAIGLAVVGSAGLLDEAEADLKAAIQLAEEIGDRQLPVWTWRALARVADLRGDSATAEERRRRSREAETLGPH